MYCRKCGTLNDDNAFKCIKCGTVIQQVPLPTVPVKKDNTAIVVLVVIGSIIGFFVLLGILALLAVPAYLEHQKGARGAPAYREVATVGSPAPDFELRDSNGNLWRLSDLRGKVVVINFWATWNPSSHLEIQYMEALYKKMQGKPFRCLAYSIEIILAISAPTSANITLAILC